MTGARRHSPLRPPLAPVLLGAALLVLGTLLPARAQSSNLERLQECAVLAADSILAIYGPADSLCVRTVEHPASWLMEGSLLAAVERRHLPLGSCDGGNVSPVSVAITAIGIEYREVADPDSVERRATLAVSGTLPYPAAESERLPGARLARSFSVVLLDTVGSAGTSSLETPGYDYTHGEIVTHDHPGFWGKIVEPAVILGASVVMVILLFSVRSQ